MKSDVINLFQHKELVQGFGLLDNTIRLSQSVVQAFQYDGRVLLTKMGFIIL